MGNAASDCYRDEEGVYVYTDGSEKCYTKAMIEELEPEDKKKIADFATNILERIPEGYEYSSGKKKCLDLAGEWLLNDEGDYCDHTKANEINKESCDGNFTPASWDKIELTNKASTCETQADIDAGKIKEDEEQRLAAEQAAKTESDRLAAEQAESDRLAAECTGKNDGSIWNTETNTCAAPVDDTGVGTFIDYKTVEGLGIVDIWFGLVVMMLLFKYIKK